MGLFVDPRNAPAIRLYTRFGFEKYDPPYFDSHTGIAYDRYAMLCIATEDNDRLRVSQLEFEAPDEPFSVQTLPKLNATYPDDRVFFVMGADSWMDILTWREWETVLSLTDHIVMTRPGRPTTGR